MIAVVTGGSGFIGRNLVQRLLRDGHQVRCLVRPRGGTPPMEAQRFVVDYGEPQSLLRSRAFDDADVVFHLAGVTRTARPLGFMTGNVTPTRHLLGALSARRLRPRFVYVSSQSAAGPAMDARHPVDETDVPHAVEEYGRSKYEAERIVTSFLDRVPVTIVRPCSVFGPHDRDFLALFRLAGRGLLVYPARGEHWLSLVHVDDLVGALLRAGSADVAIGRTYFIARADPIAWRSLGEHIAHAVGRTSVRHVHLPDSVVRAVSVFAEWTAGITGRTPLASRSRATLARQRYWVCSSARARAELDLRDTQSLPDALRDTYLWYRDNGWVRARSPAATSAT
jgi:nucleoside-diphosphate-sugar epimerase